MVTTWNKFCFNTGYVEVAISMPGSPQVPGLWPGLFTPFLNEKKLNQTAGAWSLGNLVSRRSD